MDVRNLDQLKADVAVSQHNALRADMIAIKFGTVLHASMVPVTAISAVDADDLPATINAYVTAYEAHRVSVFSASTNVGAHGSADSTNAVTSSAATNLATAITRANELKGDLNAHIAVTAKHLAASAAAVAAADATDAPSLETLLEDIYTVLSAHIGNHLTSEGITLVLP